MSKDKGTGMLAGRPSRSKAAINIADLQDKKNTVRVNFDLDREEHTKLKIYAAQKGVSITDIFRDFVNKL